MFAGFKFVRWCCRCFRPAHKAEGNSTRKHSHFENHVHFLFEDNEAVITFAVFRWTEESLRALGGEAQGTKIMRNSEGVRVPCLPLVGSGER